MICLECGKEYKAITNTHLKFHNMSMKDYNLKYDTSCLNSTQIFKNKPPWNKGKSGLQVAYNKNYCKVNHSYFKNYSSNMFYILGLIFADGCVTRHKSNSRVISLSLQHSDIDLLKAIKKELSLEKPIYISMDKRYPGKGQAKLDIYSIEMYEDLLAFGCTECKSLTMQFPKIPQAYLHDFIRGYFDGDGSIFKAKNTLEVSFTSGSYSFLEGLLAELSTLGIMGSKIYSKQSKNACYFCRFSYKGRAEDLCSFMYKDAELYLYRKFSKYKDFIK